MSLTFYRGLFTSKYHLNNIYLFLFNFKSIINSYLLIWLFHPKWANDNYYISFTNWHITNKRKVIQTFILLYYLSNTDHIPVTLVYKIFFLKFVLALAFFIHLMVIVLYFYYYYYYFFFFGGENVKLITNFTSKSL